jgi:hypothetical protein
VLSSGHRTTRGQDLDGSLPLEAPPGTVVDLVGDDLELGGGVQREVSALGQVLTKQPVGVLVGAALPGRAASQKKTGTPVESVKRRWRVISMPRSQVTDLWRAAGIGPMAAMSAAITLSVPGPSGRWSSTR